VIRMEKSVMRLITGRLDRIPACRAIGPQNEAVKPAAR
jgi:hypothetical protein